ncbi:Flagellar FliJ protein [Poriferisphaera corsica]|uniref:Flagellar FliJ protein n=1 Tax=Poriferisphaera corsica TaxID=2528020 RepID=A0A517YSF9_9BACT|nr:flagellar export protein FliJ [Poriferisphaera corsica]QDU33169.1 Flagellar FliJ protein [Poriferisphaera corsica]
MPRFRFKLDVLLKHRASEEELCQRDLARLLRSRMIFEDELRRMQQTISQSKHQLGQSLLGKVEISRVAEFASYSGQTTMRGHQIVNKMAELEQHILIAREKLLEATKKRKALELLRDKQKAEWIAAENKRETAELDEIATQKYARVMAMGGNV